MILFYGKASFAMRCEASDKKLNVAIRQKNPAFGGPKQVISVVALLDR